MNDNAKLIDDVLTKFKFKEPSGPELKSHIHNIKSGQFKKTLKRTGNYSFSFGIISSLFFLFKKAGINITIIKSALIISVSASVAAVSAGAGVYYIVKHTLINENKEPVQIEEPAVESINKIPETIQNENTVAAPPAQAGPEKTVFIDKRISVQDFTPENTGRSLAETVTVKIYEKLAEQRGTEYAVRASAAKAAEKSGLMLKGSVELLNGIYSIKAKVIDVKTLKILFYSSEQFVEPDNYEDACGKLADKIQASGV